MARTIKKAPRSIPLKKIGEILGLYRYQHDLFYLQLAEKTGLSGPTLNKAELGQKITFETLYASLEFYNVHPLDFWELVYK